MLKNQPTTIIIFFSIVITLFSSCKKENDVNEKLNSYDTSHTQNWMQDLIAVYPQATLKDISIPGAHDAGIYELNNCLGGSSCNVQTQYLNMKNMLESGIRFFDVRPVLKDGVFWTYHATSCNGLGCEGDNFENFLQQTKDFLDNHKELVIFEITHFCNTDAEDAAFLNLLTSILEDRIYKDDGSSNSNFIDRAISEVLGVNTDKGKVVLLMDGLTNVTESKSEGFFSHEYIERIGSYANKYIFEEMIEDQLIKFNDYDATGSTIFNLYYTLTLDDSLSIDCVINENAISIEDLAVEARNKITTTFDGWINNDIIVKGKIPNIIYVDFTNTDITEQCIKISEFNLE